MHHNWATKLFAANAAGSLWWFADQFLRHGPSWELVPPLGFALAAVIAAARNWLDGAQARRHAEEAHRLKLACLARCPTGLERLN